VKQSFEALLKNLKPSIAGYDFYTNFDKVLENIKLHENELIHLDTLIGSKTLEKDFKEVITKHPKVLTAIPILLAVRKSTVLIYDTELIEFDFLDRNQPIELYIKFMRETGLFDLMESNHIRSLRDYLIGIEVGLDSNARKNRGGELMTVLVRDYLSEISNVTVHEELTKKEIQRLYQIDLDSFLDLNGNQNIAAKRFDFAVKTNTHLYLIETNFYASSGSKLNETSRSFKSLGRDIDRVKDVSFIWITDGIGWHSAKNNLREAYDEIEHLYTLTDLEKGILHKVIK
jgi:type II restriction enzyme